MKTTNSSAAETNRQAAIHSASPFRFSPQSYNDISIIGNDVISPADGDYKFIDWATISYSVNSGDYSDRIEFAENRLIGVMPSVYVNSDTELDLSGNYFAKYTSDYDTAALGDIPADTDADFYLDFGRTVKAQRYRAALGQHFGLQRSARDKNGLRLCRR